MKRHIIFVLLVIFLSVTAVALFTINGRTTRTAEEDETIQLPDPDRTGSVPLETTLANRRSRRDYSDKPLTREEISQLLWSAQGITNERGFRTAPSAGATFPLELYVISGAGDELAAGVYRYNPDNDTLKKLRGTDLRSQMQDICLGQRWVGEAPVSLLITAVYERTTDRYGERGRRYVDMEVGYVSQNIYLQSEALGLGTVAVGAFDADRLHSLVELPDNETPLLVMPVGKR